MTRLNTLGIFFAASTLGLTASAQQPTVDFSQLKTLPLGSVIELNGSTGSVISKQGCRVTLKVVAASGGRRAIEIVGANAKRTRMFEFTEPVESLRITKEIVRFNQTRITGPNGVWNAPVVTIQGSLWNGGAEFYGTESGGNDQNLRCEIHSVALKRGSGSDVRPESPARPQTPVTPESPAQPPRPAPVSSKTASSMMSSFARWETDMNTWEGRRSSASPGSEAEREATREREAAGYQALMSIADVQTLARQPSPSAENFALAVDRKATAATPNSYVESVYKQAREYALWAYTESASEEIATAKWDQAASLALELNRKHSRAPADSALAQAYLPLLNFAADSAQYKYDVALSNGKVSTRDAEAAALKHDQAHSGTDSRIDRMHAALRDSALRSALYTLNSDLGTESASSLKILEARYNGSFESAAEGTALKAYYEQARDLVRGEISRR